MKLMMVSCVTSWKLVPPVQIFLSMVNVRREVHLKRTARLKHYSKYLTPTLKLLTYLIRLEP